MFVIGNRNDSDTGVIGHQLDQLGYRFEFGEREWPRGWGRLIGFDLLLLLGSDWSVNDVSHGGVVEAELALIRAAILRGTPVFGICFGAQMIALANGGRVWRAASPELGWHQITSDRHPDLFSHMWFQWHYDVFSVPHGAELVASNGTGVQAIVGKRLLGTQFHPEVTEDIIARWSQGSGSSELRLSGLNPTDLAQMSQQHVELSRNKSANLVNWFLEFSNSF